MSLWDKDVAASVHFFRDNDGLAFSWLDNSLTALGLTWFDATNAGKASFFE
jgi:hypothetical protein